MDLERVREEAEGYWPLGWAIDEEDGVVFASAGPIEVRLNYDDEPPTLSMYNHEQSLVEGEPIGDLETTLREAYEAWSERARVPIPRGSPALDQFVAAARAAGGRGIWLVRGMDAVALSWSDVPGSTDFEHSLLLTPPHNLVVLVRFEVGDDGKAGVEFRQ